MNNFLKTAFVAAGVVGTVGAVSTANAASLNVVVDKIDVCADGSDPFSCVRVYDPANSVGESATRTIDLFNATQKKGTALKLATPPAGTYETILLELSQVQVEGTTASTEISTTMSSLNIGVTDPVTGNLLLALGNVPNGGALDIAKGGSLDAVALPMVPVTVSGRGFTLPKLNISMDSSTIDDAAADEASLLASLGTFPSLSTVAVTSADNADVANLELLVSWSNAFDSVASPAGYTSGTTTLKVGLFDTKLSPAPLQVKTIKSSTTETSGTVTFVDAVSSTVVPLAWIDTDGDNKLDAGEYFAGGQTFPGAISGFEADLTTLAPTGGVVSDATFDIVGNAAVKFGPRTLTVKLPVPDQTNQAAANAGFVHSAFVDTAVILTTPASNGEATSLTFAYETLPGSAAASRTVTFDVVIGEDINNDGQVDDTDAAYFAISDTTAFDSVAGFTYVSSTDVTSAGSLTIAGIPMNIISVADGYNIGDYAYSIALDDSYGGVISATAVEFTETDETPILGNIITMEPATDVADGTPTDGAQPAELQATN